LSGKDGHDAKENKKAFMYTEFQEELLRGIKTRLNKPLSAAIEQAYRNTPRHVFVKQFYQLRQNDWEHTVIDEHNLPIKLPILYQDLPLMLVVDRDSSFLSAKSSISQPSLVLSMLNRLEIREGDSVLEIGAGSGWNAAMMGRLVGETGRVHSVEIIPELIGTAREAIAGLGIGNVTIVEGDGGEAYAPGAPYDRIMFTVGSYDIPGAFYEQLKDGGILLMVLKNVGYGDTLYQFKKTGDHFEAIHGSACAFVGLQGKYELPELNPVDITQLPFWAEIREVVVKRKSFWCGGKSQSNPHFITKSLGLISFLGIVEPWFRAFETGENRRREFFFGVVDIDGASVVTLSQEDRLTAYGSLAAFDRLVEDLRLWEELGMPDAACFKLMAYGTDVSLQVGSRQWITRRRDSQFLWTLEAEE
jgi:protein-L-isoaspartate(D-aspartate) O-methyltransferase